MKLFGLRFWAVLILPLTLIVCGCAFKGEGLGRANGAERDGLWRPVATDLRVYPSTRFAREAGQPILEARIELFDDMGDSIKGAGTFRFELYAGQAAGGAAQGRRLYAWDVNLHSLEEQLRHYDSVTRTYVFRLRVDDLSLARRGTSLQVIFLTHDQRRLETTANLSGDI